MLSRFIINWITAIRIPWAGDPHITRHHVCSLIFFSYHGWGTLVAFDLVFRNREFYAWNYFDEVPSSWGTSYCLRLSVRYDSFRYLIIFFELINNSEFYWWNAFDEGLVNISTSTLGTWDVRPLTCCDSFRHLIVFLRHIGQSRVFLHPNTTHALYLWPLLLAGLFNERKFSTHLAWCVVELKAKFCSGVLMFSRFICGTSSLNTYVLHGAGSFLTGFQPVKKFPALHGTRRFITAFTRARNLSLSWASSIQSILPYPTSWRSVLLFSLLRLDLPSGLFPSGFPTKNPV